MIIRKMTAGFGVLNGATLELKPGLNVIHGGNEFGKSTWCAFLRAMLFGVDTAQRGRNGKRPDKLLYAPWDGRPMEGSIELTADGEELTVVRKSLLPGAPMRSLEVYRTGTADRATEWENSDLGERLTGATAPVFARTAFIGTGELSVSQNPELERRIASLLTTGEEGCSYSEAAERLRSRQRALQYRSQGKLPELERKIEELEERLSTLSGMDDLLTRLEENENQLRAELERIETERTAKERAQRLELAELLRCKKERAGIAAAEAADRRAAAESLAERLSEGFLRGRAFDERAEEKAEHASTQAHELRYRAEGSELPMPLRLLPMLLGLIAGVLDRYFTSFALLLAAVVLCGVSVVLLFREASRRRRRTDAAARLADILEYYDVSSPEEILPAAREYESLYNEYGGALEEAKAAEESAAEAERELHEAMERADRLLTEEKTAEPESMELPEQLRSVRAERERLRGKRESLGDPMAIRSELEELEAEHSAMSLAYDALTAALDELEKADNELQSVFCPRLSEKAMEYFSALTDHAYSELTVSRELSALVRRSGDTVMHEETYLSRGTADQLYFSLRLALCELLLSGDDPCPLILDDALLNFDVTRMGRALLLLHKMAEKRQIILFSCQKREMRFLEKRGLL